MIFKYKDIEVNCKIEPVIKIIQNQKVSIINNRNIKKEDDVESKIYENVNPDDIELVATNSIEEKLLAEIERDSMSESTNTYMSTEDPKVTSNLINVSVNDDYIWINKTSGELFTCIDKTIDKNIWVGQLGTIIISKNVTIEGIESNEMVAYFNYDKMTGNKILSMVNEVEAISSGVHLSGTSVNGKSAYFNRDKLTISASALFSFTSDFGFCTHIRPSGSKWTSNIVDKDKTSEYSITLNTDFTISFSHGDGVNYKKYTSSLKIIKNDFNFIGITRIDGVVSVFIAHEFEDLKYDNEVIVEIFGTDFDEVTAINASTKKVILGDGDKGSFYGRLDDTYFFNRGLNMAELMLIKDKFKDNK